MSRFDLAARLTTVFQVEAALRCRYVVAPRLSVAVLATCTSNNQWCGQDSTTQDQNQDLDIQEQDFQVQDQDFEVKDQDQYFNIRVSRRLRTKTHVSRTTSLPTTAEHHTEKTEAGHQWPLYPRNNLYTYVLVQSMVPDAMEICVVVI